MDLAGSASARAVKRIEDVRVLRTAQFPEDAGPMAHPVRPDSYIEINNFYTVTIYEKGAEVVRMQHNLVGREGFAQGHEAVLRAPRRPGRDLRRLRQAMADANPGQRPGAPAAAVQALVQPGRHAPCASHGHYDAAARTYTLTLSQSCAGHARPAAKEPFVIPVELGLLGARRRALPCSWTAKAPGAAAHRGADRAQQTLTFMHMDAEPVPSLLRGFSAPVVLDCDYTDAELLTCWRTTATPSTAGKPASAWHCALLSMQ
jgi:aminopeptidase N